MVEEYLKNGKYSNILNGAEGIAIGFVDGELEMIH